MTRNLIPIVILLVLAGCDATGGNGDDVPTVEAVYVANQGNFTDGNGSVSVYDPATEITDPTAISSLGSIVQSVALVGDRLYVMSNSGNRIDVFDAATLEQVDQIPDVVSPRYLLVDGTTAYVSNLYDSIDSFTGGMVTVIDLQTHTVVKEIEVGNVAEGLALIGDRLYVANHGFGAGSMVSVIDTDENVVIETIDVECDGPRFLIADDDDEVFVFCTGNTVFEGGDVVDQTDGAVRILEGSTGEIIGRIAVDGQIGTSGPGQDAYFASDSDAIYAVKEASTILVFDADRNEMIDTIGPLDGAPIGAVAYDDRRARLYVAWNNGFSGAGEVSIHDALGAELHRFTVGVAPAHIEFGTIDE